MCIGSLPFFHSHLYATFVASKNIPETCCCPFVVKRCFVPSWTAKLLPVPPLASWGWRKLASLPSPYQWMPRETARGRLVSSCYIVHREHRGDACPKEPWIGCQEISDQHLSRIFRVFLCGLGQYVCPTRVLQGHVRVGDRQQVPLILNCQAVWEAFYQLKYRKRLFHSSAPQVEQKEGRSLWAGWEACDCMCP